MIKNIGKEENLNKAVEDCLKRLTYCAPSEGYYERILAYNGNNYKLIIQIKPTHNHNHHLEVID